MKDQIDLLSLSFEEFERRALSADHVQHLRKTASVWGSIMKDERLLAWLITNFTSDDEARALRVALKAK